MDKEIFGEYCHKKTGKVYFVTALAINTTNAQDQQEMVIYNGFGKNFVRSLSEFNEKFIKIERENPIPTPRNI